MFLTVAFDDDTKLDFLINTEGEPIAIMNGDKRDFSDDLDEALDNVVPQPARLEVVLDDIDTVAEEGLEVGKRVDLYYRPERGSVPFWSAMITSIKEG